MQANDHNTIPVWDPLVRTLHWVLVVGFFTAYLTEDDLLTTHTWAGYAVGGVVLVRLVWGFVGPRHARFADFVYPPRRVLRYGLELMLLSPRERFLGHSPTGGVMVFALLLGIAVTVWSGLEVLAREEGAGPLAGVHPAVATVSVAVADDEDGEEDDERRLEREGAGEFWENAHELAANVTLALVLLHVGGVLLASFVHRENLVLAMFTGRKPRD